MLTAVLSLGGALVYGAADFLGGLAARRLGALLATAISAVAGLAALLVVLPFTGGDPAPADFAIGAAAGLVLAVGIALLYASLAIGPMSILSPLTALVSAVVPMAWGLATGDSFGPLGVAALGIALVAVVLVGLAPGEGAVRPSLRGILFGVGAGAGIGAYYIVIDGTADASGLWPLAAARTAMGVLLFAAVGVAALRARAARRANGSVEPAERAGLGPGIRLAIVCGLVDATANVLLLLGIRAGELAVAAVLGAMYPAGTILLAAIVLGERVAPLQWTGLVLALVAAGLFALA
ncbi:EamA family transporter [Agromyces seonyuensis]|uniref:EamA family transporter n=1 Tax=Agromyces seonyuensis TaxID=2662446 RepID=A0A6I4P2K4_9MICO|nr:EamA family transporter [Agromyces seonyuensis]